MILHIPHSSQYIPVLYDKLDNETIFNYTDIDTDKLFWHESADMMIFPYSRFYVDVERLENDPLELEHHGLYYTHDYKNIQYRTNSEYDHAKELYDIWHKNLKNNILKNLSYSEKVILVDCHSFSDIQIGTYGPDICIGTNEHTTSEKLKSIVYESFNSLGYNVEINYPYSNSIEPIQDDGFETIMIEVNKRLYMNDNFDSVKKDITNILNEIHKYEISVS